MAGDAGLARDLLEAGLRGAARIQHDGLDHVLASRPMAGFAAYSLFDAGRGQAARNRRGGVAFEAGRVALRVGDALLPGLFQSLRRG